MQRASDQHRKQDPKSAADKQRQAIDDLERAMQEIEKALAQLREEEREEILAALEARFREILERHRPVTASTVELETTRGKREWTRTDRLRLTDITDEEGKLAILTQKALDILVEDGTTVIFPQIVSQLRDDMRSVQHLLSREQTGKYTQELEKEIEQTLEELIAALERARKEQQQQQQASQSQPSQPQLQPLVPSSAELKLLKSAQFRVNKRTQAFDRARPEGQLEALMKGHLDKITQRQADVAKMTEEMIER
jgi:hypothetical protein